MVVVVVVFVKIIQAIRDPKVTYGARQIRLGESPAGGQLVLLSQAGVGDRRVVRAETETCSTFNKSVDRSSE